MFKRLFGRNPKPQPVRLQRHHLVDADLQLTKAGSRVEIRTLLKDGQCYGTELDAWEILNGIDLFPRNWER